MNKKIYFEQFPNIVFPRWLVELGFQDNSWHNDVLAKAEFALNHKTLLIVWFDEEDPTKRECDGCAQFCIQIQTHEGIILQEKTCETLEELDGIVKKTLEDFCVPICEWCAVAGEDCKETSVGCVCFQCAEAIKSRGVKL